jgi:CheY-like chemotaxis protein
MAQTDSRRGVVLIVEDEPIVRLHASLIFESFGFDYVECSRASTALSILERRPDITHLFTDVVMPDEIDGLDLAREVHSRRPDIHVVLTSALQSCASSVFPFVRKPWRERDIEAALSRTGAD